MEGERRLRKVEKDIVLEEISRSKAKEGRGRCKREKGEAGVE